MVKRAFTLMAVVTLLCSAPLAGQQVADHVAMGVAANDAHDTKTALQHFQAALEQDSMSYEANWRGALALIDLGQQTPSRGTGRQRDSLFQLASRYAGRAVAANSTGADGHFAVAAALGLSVLDKSRKERIRSAAAIRREALRTIELNPRHDGAYHILGVWNAEIMRLSGLSRFFAKTFLGAGIFGQASWSRAIANMEKAVELDPGRIYHHLELARIYADRKRTADARTQLRLVDSLPAREVMDSVYKREAADLKRSITKR